MTVESFPVQLQGWARRYAQGDEGVRACYDYHPAGDETARYRELQTRDFDREALRQALYQYHQTYENHDLALEQIDKLQDGRSVVVVGGQQAGLLTGPIYTISKALTVLLKAKEAEATLDVPVIPMFWIAGEDHDWDEVNHIYIHGHDGTVKKVKYEGETKTGAPVSEQPIDMEAMRRWLQKIFLEYRETPYSYDLYRKLESFAQKSATISDFFAEVMLWLFRKQGLVLIDPQQPAFRRLMTQSWTELLEDNERVRQAFAVGKESVEAENDGEAFIETTRDNAHLFYSVDGRREKMIAHEDGGLSLQNGQYKMSRTDWSREARKHPEKFSSNVFTRPYIQERLLPVLTFIAGPGEAAYWAMVGPLFHQFRRFVPPVSLRMQQTYVDRTSEKTLDVEALSAEDVTTEGTSAHIHDLKENNRRWDTDDLFRQSLALAGEGHQTLAKALETLAPSEERFADKNYQRLEQVLKELQLRIERKQMENIQPRVEKLEQLQKRLCPHEKLQERVLNIVQLLNEYGEERVLTMFAQLELEMLRHQFIYL